MFVLFMWSAAAGDAADVDDLALWLDTPHSPHSQFVLGIRVFD